MVKDRKLRFRGSFLLNAALCEIQIDDKHALLVKPAAYMNNAGGVIKKVLGRFKADLASVMIVHDDIDLPLGTLRFRESGSAGGQRGMVSIMDTLNTHNLNRLRVGIGRPQDSLDTADYVLSEFSRNEIEVSQKTISLAARACEDWVKFGGGYVMKNYNRQLV
jgi:PTH1 family peptidyl-tRNA hydrolase